MKVTDFLGFIKNQSYKLEDPFELLDALCSDRAKVEYY